MLKIGLSACFMYPDPNREVFGPKTLLYMGHDMSHYLGLSGVMPILIPDLPDDIFFYEFLDQLDGLLLQGGLDINPKLYGEDPLAIDIDNDPKRDFYELKILEYATIKEMPILGICRGMQMLNIFFGGSLYQDIKAANKNAHNHVCNELYDEHTHGIEFIKGSLYEKIYAKEKCRIVNSVHHQGIKKLGKDLIIEAVCLEDGLIEALSWAGPKGGMTPYKDGLVTGIQWHPEFFHTMKNETICARPTIDHFLKLCQIYKDAK